VPPESQGVKHQAQRFVFVDEWSCIACRNCCDVAPKTFCIDADAGRARVFSQWGNSEEDLDYAVSACPVDCISWVDRPQLQALEYVTRRELYEVGNQLPCPMAIRQGSVEGKKDPFQLAQDFAQGVASESDKARNQGRAALLSKSAAVVQERIQAVFSNLKGHLRDVGWRAFKRLR